MNPMKVGIALFALVGLALVSVSEGSQWLSGEGYKSLKFDGTSYVEIPSAVSSSAGKEFTFEAWIKIDDTESSGSRPIVSRFLPSPSNDVSNDFNLNLNEQGYLVFFVGGSTELGFLMVSSNPLEANRWYHVAFTIEYQDINSNFPLRATLYADAWATNGALIRDRQDAYWFGPSYPRTVLTSEIITVGKYVNDKHTTGQFFQGELDEVRVWMGPRSASDIQNFAQRTVDDNKKDDFIVSGSTQLIASYSFNHDLASIVDAMGKHNAINYNAVHVSSSVELVTFAYATNAIPLTIPLYGIRDDNTTFVPYTIFVQFSKTEILGELYQVGTGGALNKAKPIIPTQFLGATTYGPQVKTGTTFVGTAVTYLYIPQAGADARFFYSVSDGQTSSGLTEVRIQIDCAQDASEVDMECGVCNGDGSEKDVCGICFGDGSTCVGCDGKMDEGEGLKHYDACGICGGDGTSCLGCDDIPNSGLVEDACGECGGDNSTCTGCDGVLYSGLHNDSCGVCGGHDESKGCDGVCHSGLVVDACGVCGGNNGTCQGCDGSGGGVVDDCGVCNGDNSTCGGCDGNGGVKDVCDVCNGDGSTCTCVLYHGYQVQEMDYILLQWGLGRTIKDLDEVIVNLDESLGLLNNYDGDADLASVVLYFNDFLKTSLDEYEKTVDAFTSELDISLGNKYNGKPMPNSWLP